MWSLTVRGCCVCSALAGGSALRPQGPHFFEHDGGALAVTESHQPVRVIKSRTSARRLRRALLGLPFARTDPYAIRDPYAARHSSVKKSRCGGCASTTTP
jgi:hypothetical protein